MARLPSQVRLFHIEEFELGFGWLERPPPRSSCIFAVCFSAVRSTCRSSSGAGDPLRGRGSNSASAWRGTSASPSGVGELSSVRGSTSPCSSRSTCLSRAGSGDRLRGRVGRVRIGSVDRSRSFKTRFCPACLHLNVLRMCLVLLNTGHPHRTRACMVEMCMCVLLHLVLCM